MLNDNVHTKFLVNCIDDFINRNETTLKPVELEALNRSARRLETQAEEIDTLRGDLFDAMEELRAR